MEEQNNSTITNEEKLISLLSHLSIFFGSLIVPIVLWAVCKDKSQYIRFQSLQTIFFQLSYTVLIIIIIILFAGLGIVGGIITSGDPAGGELPVFFIIPFLIMYGLIILSTIAVLAYSTYMGVKAYQGEIKKYILVGKIIYNNVYLK